MTCGNDDPVRIWLASDQPVKVSGDELRKPGKLDRRELALSAKRAGEGIRRHPDSKGHVIGRARLDGTYDFR
jgi:hypothetical protein